MNKIKLLLLVFLLHFSNDLISQHSSEIFQALKKLEVTNTVLFIAAHPDDENTRLITWMSKEKLFRTAYLSLTRGDGGQNLIGSELSENLGLIRTRELMAARAIDGGEQFFTRAYDFGYSKTTEETLEFWEREKVLEDMVYVIRKIKPDVIICRFPPDSRAGHGHHSASAVLGNEAFEAAADPKRFPDQLKTLSTWQVKRIYWNTFRFGSNNTITEQQVKVDVGGYNVLNGKSNGELAAESRSQHKSQGFGVPGQRGTLMEYFSPMAGDTVVSDPFVNLPSYWEQSKTGTEISLLIQKTIGAYNFLQPASSLEALLKIRSLLKQLPESTIQIQKLKEVNKLILDVTGCWVAAYSYRERYAVGDTMHITFQSILRNFDQATIRITSDHRTDTLSPILLVKQQLQSRSIILNGSASLSQPYWLASDHPKGIFTLPSASLTGQPWNDYPKKISFDLFLKDDTIQMEIPVTFKETDPVRGELFHPLIVSPLLTGTLSESKSIFSENKPRNYQLNINYWGARDSAITISALVTANGWKSTFKDTTLLFKPNAAPIEIKFSIQPDAKSPLPTSIKFYYRTNSSTQVEIQGNTTINYTHIPRITWFPKLQIDLQKIDIKIGKTNLLYIKGAGDEVAASLRQIGYKIDEVTASAIHTLDLKKYDAIITGIRAYNTDDDLANVYTKIFQYIQDGGTYIVQYNTNSNLHPSNFKTPYPFSISRNRVTDENAKVSFTQPNDRIFQSPNKITSQDFEGWIQERGLYFANKIDSSYTNLLLMNDKDESPLEGSLIRCNYGKGEFIYTGLSFFRQLPAGVPGAFRLFSNLIGTKP